MKPLHYKAFISYSHQDEAWARWLQASLEKYRVPRRLVGTNGLFGPIPERLTPIFRDREDLSSAADLTGQIKGELEASETLMVICSPAAAASRWVNEEIRYFRSLGRENRILALIVAGDPASGAGEPSCFPPALVERPDGRRYEPLAADARKYADGKPLACLKLIAGMLGIRLDELRRRDAQRRRRNRLVSLGAAAVILAVTGALAFTAISSRNAALRQKSNSEELLGYMLGNLDTLEPIMGLEVIDRSDAEVMAYLENLGFQGMDNERLVEAALSWRAEGLELKNRRDLAESMEAFQKSRAAFIELNQREHGSASALFELGQAEFYVGYVQLDQGDLDEAQASFTRYGAITRRLVNSDPKNAEMIMELSYSLINLGGLEAGRQNPDTDKTLELMQSAVQYNQMALVLDPENAVYRQELVNARAFLADAWLEVCNPGKAYELMQQNVSLSRQFATEAPDRRERQVDLAYALSGLAAIQRQLSLTELALEGFRESEKLLSAVLLQDSENRDLNWQVNLRKQWILLLLAYTGHAEASWEGYKTLLPVWQSDFENGMKSDFSAAVDLAAMEINYSTLARNMGDHAAARAELNKALERLLQLIREKPDNRASRSQMVRAAFEQWVQTGELPAADVNVALGNYLRDPAGVKSCSDTGLAARLAVMHGDEILARRYTSYLRGKGFFDPEFMGFCQSYGICD